MLTAALTAVLTTAPAALFTLALTASLQVGSRTLQVAPAGDFATVGEAVRAASAGDTVRVAAGIYREPTVVLDKRLTLIGEPGAVLDGQGERTIILITADSVQVIGLSIRNTGVSQIEDRSGILVDKSQYCSIRDNELDATFFGIYLAN